MRPTGKREIAENVLTAVLCAAATALLDAGIKAVREAREKRQEQEPRESKVVVVMQDEETPKKKRKGKK